MNIQVPVVWNKNTLGQWDAHVGQYRLTVSEESKNKFYWFIRVYNHNTNWNQVLDSGTSSISLSKAQNLAEQSLTRLLSAGRR